jgi:queuine tRNA-ribosyltransferase
MDKHNSGGFQGIAVGGALGSSLTEMRELLKDLELPMELPRHLLGIADPFSLRSVIELGFDSFDSVFPTRAARHGNAFVLYSGARGKLDAKGEKIGHARYRDETGGLGPVKCECWTCKSHRQEKERKQGVCAHGKQCWIIASSCQKS